MKAIHWNAIKNAQLKLTRGVSFEDILAERLVAVKENPVRTHQRILLFDRQGYIWVVPFVEKENELFLKTLYPSRKYTKIYRGEMK